MKPEEQKNQDAANKKITGMLVVMAFFMTGFGFALVPLYEVFCDVTGLRFTDLEEKAQSQIAAKPDVDLNRKVRVQFIANMHDKTHWTFKPKVFQMEVHPGQMQETTFYASNLSQTNKVGQAVQNLVPAVATPYFHKTECFCFSEQAFKPNEGKEMPLRFIVDPDLPEEITTVTLSYTFFELDKVAVSN